MPWPTNWVCAAWRSKWTTFRGSSTGSPRTATTWSAALVSTRASGAWRLCADPRGSSCPWPSESTNPRPSKLCPAGYSEARTGLLKGDPGRTTRRCLHALHRLEHGRLRIPGSGCLHLGVDVTDCEHLSTCEVLKCGHHGGHFVPAAGPGWLPAAEPDPPAGYG